MLQGNVLEEERASFAIKQASLENEIKQLKQQLSNKSKKETEIERRLEDENKLNGFLQQELNELKINKERASLFSLQVDAYVYWSSLQYTSLVSMDMILLYTL